MFSDVIDELTEHDDPDDYAPPLLICIAVALFYLVPWVRVLRIFGLTVVIVCGIILLVY